MSEKRTSQNAPAFGAVIVRGYPAFSLNLELNSAPGAPCVVEGEQHTR